jgi:hypothetical protein
MRVVGLTILDFMTLIMFGEKQKNYVFHASVPSHLLGPLFSFL